MTTSTQSLLRVGVVGAGYFGRLHAQKLLASPRATLSGIADADSSRADALAAECAVPALVYAELLAASDAIVVAAPAAVHFPLASQALAAGRHVLVEKPIAANLAEADALAALATEHRLVLQVGHLLRYTAEHAAIRARLPHPRAVECVRVAPFRPRGTDVSVVLDLMIHDLDFVFSLIDSPVQRIEAVGATIASGRTDIATAHIAFENGAVATLTASRVAPAIERSMRLFDAKSCLTLDFAARRLTLATAGPDGTDDGVPHGVFIETAEWEPTDALVAEHEAFAAAVLDGAPVVVDAAAGRRALAAGLAVEAAIAEAAAQP